MSNLQQSLSGLYNIASKLNTKINTNIDYISGQVDKKATIEYLTGAIDTAKTQLIEQFAGAFHFKGTVSEISDLANIENPVTGDVYQVNELSSEFAYNGTDWVELGSFVDLSDYYIKDEVDQEITKATSGKVEQTVYNTFKEDYDNLKAAYQAVSGTFALSTDVNTELTNVQGHINYMSGQVSELNNQIEYVSGIVNDKADLDYLTGNYALSADVPLSTSQLVNDTQFIDYHTFNNQLDIIRNKIEQLEALI